jgi:hypothetical protein
LKIKTLLKLWSTHRSSPQRFLTIDPPARHTTDC